MEKLITQYSLEQGAYAPTKAHDDDAAFDLKAPKGTFIMLVPGKKVTIDTGVHMYIPKGYAGLMVAKSGLNVNHNILSTGLIDAGYTGSIRVKLYNHSRVESYTIVEGDKISQLMVVPIPLVELEMTDLIPQTDRGGNGFGSSGR